MCGRFTLFTAVAVLKEVFGLDEASLPLEPRYNIAPSQMIAVVPNRDRRALELHRWGLIPSWAKDPAIGNRMINARAETLDEKPSFRDALRRRRCLIPADGFFEWKRAGPAKTPMWVRLKSGRPMALAGLWDVWKSPEGKVVATATIITTRANELMAGIHDRMPAILRPDQFQAWLAPGPADPRDLKGLLEPIDSAELETYPVSPRVNSPEVDDPDCVKPAAAAGPA